jgi:hypothetical protein
MFKRSQPESGPARLGLVAHALGTVSRMAEELADEHQGAAHRDFKALAEAVRAMVRTYGDLEPTWMVPTSRANHAPRQTDDTVRNAIIKRLSTPGFRQQTFRELRRAIPGGDVILQRALRAGLKSGLFLSTELHEHTLYEVNHERSVARAV